MKVEEKLSVEMTEEDKELFQKQLDEDLANAEKELERANKNLAEHEFVYKQQCEILNLMTKAKDVILNNVDVVNATYKYETMPEYTALLKAQESLKFDQSYYTLKEQSIPSMERTIKAKKETIKSLKEKINKMKGD
jgi:hypothetical protein